MNAAQARREIDRLLRIAGDHRERMRVFRLSKADEEVARLEAERCEARAEELARSSRAA